MNHGSDARCRLSLVLTGALAIWNGAFAAEPAGLETPREDVAALIAGVRPFVHPATPDRTLPARSRQLLQGFHDSILDWSEVLAKHFVPVPGHSDWGYYGLPGNTEDDVRPITYAVQVNAFLSELDPPSGPIDAERRARRRREAIAVLRYLTHSHISGGGNCLNGKPWGNAWQSAMWARSAGLGGWLLWPHLDASMRQAVARMVAFEADRFINRPPRDQEFSNTGAEENAWDAMITSLAANMMPGHLHAAVWGRRAKLYLYNSLSRRADHSNDARGDEDRPVREWVNTVNAHPDFTIENHGLVHVGYLKLTVGEMLENAVHYIMGRSPVPRACLHNVPEAYQILLRCMAWDGAPIPFGGNDWKITHTQCTDIVIHSVLSVLKGDSVAAYLEDVSLETLRSIQKDEGGFYNVRRDLEYGGICATRLMSCYLAHALLPSSVVSASAAEFNRQASGVKLLEQGEAILHRTPTKFTSFTWGPNRMALAMPFDGTWVVWPHYASYLGLINGKTPARANAKMEILRHTVGSNSFDVRGRMTRSGGVTHDFAYASLSNDITVYVERLHTADGGQLRERETGIVGHEYPMGQNERVLRGRHGSTRVIGIGGGDAVTLMPTDWLNVGDRIGYVVCRTSGRSNVMRYHGEERGSGRVPLLQEYFSLVGDEAGTSSSGEDWACIVTFLNQSADETAALVDRIVFAVQGNTATCQVGSDFVRVDFDTFETAISESSTLQPTLP